MTVFIAGYFSSSLKPTFSKEIHNDKVALAKVIEKSSLVMLLSAIPISVICITFSREIIIFLSNSDFVSGAPALILLALSLPLIYLVTLLSEILIANDSRKILLNIAIFILIFNFLVNLIAIPLYSFMGAAVTTLISEIVLLVIIIYYTKKIVPFSVGTSSILKSFILFILTLFSAFLLKGFINIHFIILIAIVLFIYVFWGQILGVINTKSLLKLMKNE